MFRSALFVILFSTLAPSVAPTLAGEINANRMTRLDAFSDPFGVDHTTAKLITPQWIGEEGVEVAVILSVDDMNNHEPFENYLRPMIERLKQIDGRAPISIMCNRPNPNEPHLQVWLKEGLSLETHTLHHPCPLLHNGDFGASAATYHGCVDLLASVPNSTPVAYRMVCFDSINDSSPRYYAEIFNKKSEQGRFVTISSSLSMMFTESDPEQPAGYTTDADGAPRFRKYAGGNRTWVNYIENYPYPFVVGRICWEFPSQIPDDWQGQNILGNAHPRVLADMKAAFDATARKKGLHTQTFHTAGWIANHQLVELIDHIDTTYGKRVKFLTFREAQQRINQYMLKGQPIRHPETGEDNGVRILDVNNDGYMDVLIGNEKLQLTRIWDPQHNRWIDSPLPVRFVTVGRDGVRRNTGVRFGVLQPTCEKAKNPTGYASMLVRNDEMSGAWHFDGKNWAAAPEALVGLEADGLIYTQQGGRDRGVRMRDLDNDGVCELIVGNDTQNAVFRWIPCRKTWTRLAFNLPAQTAIVTTAGGDAGLRFVDVNQDGYDDVVFSDAARYSLHLFESMERGWSRKAMRGERGQHDAAQDIPMIVRADGTNNGAWFSDGFMWVQNEDTHNMPDLVDRRSFDALLANVPPEPKEAQASFEALRPRPGFTVELVAAEPLVMDPIAFDWGADGKLWVVEMADYPLGLDDAGEPGGRVRFLEDLDGDGKYDQSTLFVDKIPFPTDIMPWRDGVLVTAAPNIWYFEDTDGDGKADVKEKRYVGFGEGNQQHRVNGLRYGLDNWVYIANGDSGGHIRSTRTGDVVDINGRDLRIRPDTGELDAATGMTQYGRNRDDWGNWYGCNNSFPLYQFVLPDHYLRRNARLAVHNTTRMIASLDNAPIYPAGRILNHFVGYTPPPPGQPSKFTSAGSTIIYRDDLFGDAFTQNMFVSEPVHNLVHRRVLVPDGVSYTSHRAEDEAGIEFLASTDPWFRPTGVRTGPDGAIWVADMYRMVIEHPEWIDDALEQTLDLRAGHDKGRIYRVFPTDAPPRRIPRLDKLTTAELVAALDSPSGWQRDMAQRLLLWKNDKTAISPLRKLAQSGNRALARLHALCTLDGLGALDAKLLQDALADRHPAVRRHAARLSEQFAGASPQLGQALVALADDVDPQVLLQVAFSLGAWDTAAAGEAIGRIAARHVDDPFLATAAMSSAAARPSDVLAGISRSGVDPARTAPLINELIDIALAQESDATTAKLLAIIATPFDDTFATWQYEALARLRDALDRNGKTIEALPGGDDIAKRLAAISRAARATALNEDTPVDQRAVAVALLGQDEATRDDDIAALTALLAPQTPGALQEAAIDALGRIRDPRVAGALIDNWKTYSPAVRNGVLNVLMRREDHVAALLDAIAANRIGEVELGATYRQLLLEHPAESIRSRAGTLLGRTANTSRRQVIDEYLAAIKATHGDAQRGLTVFSQNCAQCHRVGTIGIGAGPNLAALVDKSAEYMVPHILDPNRAVEDKYLNYALQTIWGDTYNGLLVSETGNSIVIMGLDGVEVTVLRDEIQPGTFQRSAKSMMPEGLEQFVTAQDLADVIAFVNANVAPPKQFAGNQPALVSASERGELQLLATNAEIRGDTLVYEATYQNLGYWMSDNDYAAWSVQVDAAGQYDVYLDWAVPANDHGHTLALVTTDGTLEHTIAPTGTWDDYRQAKIGTIKLEAGVHRLIAKPGKPVQGAIIDLRELRLVPAGRNTAEKPAYKIVPGNKPAPVKPDGGNHLHLLAANAELYGASIAVYEPQRCIGWWTEENDRAVWRIENATAGVYDVYLEWAIPDDMAGNRFTIRTGDSQLKGTIPTTGGFEHYKIEKFGQLKLVAGRNTIEMQSAGPIKGELADLRQVKLVPAAQ